MTAVQQPPPIEAEQEPARPDPRRARSLHGTLGIVLLGAVIPGAGLLYLGRRLLGLLVLLSALGGLGWTVWRYGRRHDAVALAFDPAALHRAAGVLVAVVAVWAVTVVATYALARPRNRTWVETLLGSAVVLAIVVAGTVPVVLSARYANVQADLVHKIFDNNRTATAPQVTLQDPWHGKNRVNVLLLGGDSSPGRTGVRTDTVILASADTRTGKVVLFSLPRNMMYAQFPRSSPLHRLYPHGFRGPGDPSSWMLNAIYGQVPLLHPGALGKSADEGADAIKQAVSGSLGIPVDYYVLVEIDGFRQIVNAMGGITVNINEPVAINGDTDRGIPPTGYLQPGPHQHLDGFHALWFARGRWGSDDYERMARQRCAIGALVDAAKPLTLLRRYQSLAAAGKRILRTDIPRSLMPAFVDLAFKVKEHPVHSVVFRTSDKFFSGDPNYRYVRTRAAQAIKASESPHPRRHRAAAGDNVKDSCAYHPVS